jgi:hypothetical protein
MILSRTSSGSTPRANIAPPDNPARPPTAAPARGPRLIRATEPRRTEAPAEPRDLEGHEGAEPSATTPAPARPATAEGVIAHLRELPAEEGQALLMQLGDVLPPQVLDMILARRRG